MDVFIGNISLVCTKSTVLLDPVVKAIVGYRARIEVRGEEISTVYRGVEVGLLHAVDRRTCFSGSSYYWIDRAKS